jgi:hypothetical protein
MSQSKSLFRPESSSPPLLDQHDARKIEDENKATTDENIRMNSGSSSRRKESSSSSSSKPSSSRKSSEGERSKSRGNRDRETSFHRERNSASSRGGEGTRPSPEDGRGQKGTLPLQASRGSRSGRDRDGVREGKAERGSLIPPPPSSTSSNRDRPSRDRVMSSSYMKVAGGSSVKNSTGDADDAVSPNAAAAFAAAMSSSTSFSPRGGGGGDGVGRVGNRRINDDSVQIDHLPMADLMAYLQLVANNSSNLPLTRRDDPELGRTVSSLTPEEYATKCAAFVPSMVRIFGGQYGKYGSIWDLKTSEVSFFSFHDLFGSRVAKS